MLHFGVDIFDADSAQPFDQDFEDWFDKAIDDELFALTAPRAQYDLARAAWEAGKNMKKGRET